MKTISFLVSIILSLHIQACSSSGITFTGDNFDAEEESLVFGRIRVVSNEERACTLLMSSDVSKKYFESDLSDDGWFCWHLKQGSYTITGIRSTFVGQRKNILGLMEKAQIVSLSRVYARCIIERPQSLVYCGTLVIYFEGEAAYIKVENEYESAYKHFGEQFPGINLDAVTNVFQMEKSR